MGKYLNISDLLLIAFSAFVIVWGANMLLRNVNMGAYQA